MTSTTGTITVNPQPQQTCPNCGYCPHCGRTSVSPHPSYQYPYWYQPVWYDDGTYRITSTNGFGETTSTTS